MRYPDSLPKNGTIGFVAPSFGCAIEPYKTAFQNAQKKWIEQGYQLNLGPNCYAGKGIGISNTPQACAEELMQYYIKEEVDCLISCGGGELMCTILDYVDFEQMAKARPKWYMGYSDNTNMTFLQAVLCDTASVYGPCASSFGMEPWHKSLQDAMGILAGAATVTLENSSGWKIGNYDGWERESFKNEEMPLAPYHITEPLQMRTYVGREETGEALHFEGRLLGGCVDCLITLVGSKYDQVEAFQNRYREDGTIWFLESCELNPMEIRRAFWQMDQAGWFRDVKGFLIGRPGVSHEQELMGLDQYEAILDVVGKYQVPVVMDMDLGHIPPMMPIVTGSYGKTAVKGNKIVLDMYKI